MYYASNRRTKRDLTAWGGAQLVHRSYDEFLQAPVLETGVHSIHDNGEVIDFYYHNENSDKLAVFFHGAIKAAQVDSISLSTFHTRDVDAG